MAFTDFSSIFAIEKMWWVICLSLRYIKLKMLMLKLPLAELISILDFSISKRVSIFWEAAMLPDIKL